MNNPFLLAYERAAVQDSQRVAHGCFAASELLWKIVDVMIERRIANG